MATNYSAKERAIAKLLSSFPGIKSFAKKSYQRLNYLIHKKGYTHKSQYDLASIEIPDYETFFGYYDKSPISADGRYVLLHAVSFSTKKLPQGNVCIFVKAYDIETKTEVFSYQVAAYNWQQGAKMQWLTADTFIFNNYEDGRYISIKVSLKQGTKEKIPYPIYDCFKDKYALTLNFERLMALRPDYGYRNKPLLSQQALVDTSNDGIYRFDFSDLNKRLILSIEDVMKVGYQDKMKEGLHKVNHIMIAPDGERFMFLHRYFVNGQRFDRLMMANHDGTGLKLLSDDGMVSHCYWLDNNTIIGYLRDRTTGDKYYKVDANTGTKEILGKGIIDRFGDGHPSVWNGKILFDTYPNKARMKHLFIFDIWTNNLEEIGEFYESLSYYNETRCDLHPRFSPDGSKVFIDSVHSGTRQLYWLNLKK